MTGGPAALQDGGRDHAEPERVHLGRGHLLLGPHLDVAALEICAETYATQCAWPVTHPNSTPNSSCVDEWGRPTALDG